MEMDRGNRSDQMECGEESLVAEGFQVFENQVDVENPAFAESMEFVVVRILRINSRTEMVVLFSY